MHLAARATTIVAVAMAAVTALIASSAPGAVRPPGAAASVVAGQPTGELQVPLAVAGLVAESNPGTRETVDALRARLILAAGLTVTAGAVYADANGSPRSVVFAVGTGGVAAPADAVNAAITAAGADGAAVTRVRDVPAGTQGGVARCGSADTEAEPTVTCAWADAGSVGVAVFANRPMAEAASILVALRDSMNRTSGTHSD